MSSRIWNLAAENAPVKTDRLAINGASDEDARYVTPELLQQINLYTSTIANGDLDGSFEVIKTHSLGAAIPTVTLIGQTSKLDITSDVTITHTDTNNTKINFGFALTEIISIKITEF